jgi:hypothetical protein
MTKFHFYFLFLTGIFFASTPLFSQTKIETGDPSNPTNLPVFFKSKISDIEFEIENVKSGKVNTVATSPSGLPVYSVSYGEKDDFKSSANYNSAVGAKNPAYYAQKDNSSKPVLFFIGPVHGQEIENIVGLINLIHVAETGTDYRGKDWSELKRKIELCRTIIIPCGNPDGRKRCPYDSFVGIPTKTMTKYGQGTRKDGSLYGWPLAKSIHPMKGDVGILGAYFNNNGVNLMQDEFFKPMAKETEAIMEIARSEAPDIIVSLHSHENSPMILSPAFVGMFMKERVHDLALRVNNRYKKAGIEHVEETWFWKPGLDDLESPTNTFNLTSALHHISGAMSFTFECCHGSLSKKTDKAKVDYNDILDIQLILYDEMYNYILENRLLWQK